MTYQFKLRVYFEDTDAAGVVYYGNYLKFMERARSQWFTDCSIGMRALMQEHSLVFVVSRTELNYHRSAKLEDLLSVSVQLQDLRRVSAVFEQRITRDGELICSGLTRVGCVNTVTMKPSPIPPEVMQDLQKLVA